MHVNNLNKSLQGKGTTVFFMHKKVLDFKDKCRLLKNHLQQHNFFHFPQLTDLIVSKEIQVNKVSFALFCNIFYAVLRDFSHRFQDFEKILKTLRLIIVAFPHQIETESALMDLRMELVKIKNNEQLVQKLRTKKICWKPGKVQLNIQ